MLELINETRKNKKITIKQLAKLLKVDDSLMSRMLSGKRPISETQVLKIGEFLELNISELMQLYLSDKIISVVKDYPLVASKALKLAEERVEYLTGNLKYKTIPLDSDLKTKLALLDDLHAEWRAKKPLKGVQLEKLNTFFNTQYTHESNRIEGNTLTFQETHLVVNEGITIGGKSMREHLEAVNHKEAIALITDFVSENLKFTNSRLLMIHQLILKGIQPKDAGKYRSVPVRISGSAHVPPEPYLIDKLMEDYFIFYDLQKDKLHPVILAAEMHERLVSIHPFIDGNGRTSRLVMNLILLSNGFTICNLKGDLDARMVYYKALEQVQINHNQSDFYHLIADHCISSLQEHIQLAG